MKSGCVKRMRRYVGRLTVTEKTLMVMLVWTIWMIVAVPYAGRYQAQETALEQQEKAWVMVGATLQNNPEVASAILKGDTQAAEKITQYFRSHEGYVGVRWTQNNRRFYTDLPSRPDATVHTTTVAPTGDLAQGQVTFYYSDDVIVSAGWDLQKNLIIWTAILAILALPLVFIVGRGGAHPFRKMSAALMSGRVELLDHIEGNDLEMQYLKDAIRGAVAKRKNTQIAHQKELEKHLDQLKLAERGAVVHDAQKDRVLANLSHDMRSPLGTIRLVLDIMLNEADASLKLEAYNTATNELETLLQNIENIMAQAKIEENKITITTELLNIKTLVESIVRAKALDVMGSDITVKAEVEPGIEQFITDSEMLTRIVRNLLDNAVRYARKAPVVCKVVERGRNIFISVSDDGPGVPKNIRNKIFDVYYTTANKANGEEGTGIGLSVVKTYTQQLGGHVSLKTSSEGTTFIVSLPRKEPLVKLQVVNAEKKRVAQNG